MYANVNHRRSVFTEPFKYVKHTYTRTRKASFVIIGPLVYNVFNDDDITKRDYALALMYQDLILCEIIVSRVLFEAAGLVSRA